MWVNEIVTYLEMTHGDQLRAAKPPPSAVVMAAQDAGSPLLRATHDRVAAPYHWGSLTWSEQEWQEQQAGAHRRHWVAVVGDKAAGLLTVELQPGAEAEIVSFGLVPEFVGRGYGGHILTRSIQLAWNLPTAGAEHVRRVWLHTSSLDHPHALRNYERRGFRRFRTETGLREVPD